MNRVKLLIDAARLLPPSAEHMRQELLGFASELADQNLIAASGEIEGLPPPGILNGSEPGGTHALGFPLAVFALYKGTRYEATMRATDIIEMNGKHYSPSAAAVAITGYPTNGYLFWRYMDEFRRTQKIDKLRRE